MEQGQVTVLAILETAIASGIALWYAWTSESLTHLLIASLLTPFLLLRTDTTFWTTERLFSAMFYYVRFPVRRNSLRIIVVSFYSAAAFIILLMAKAAGVATTCIRAPLNTMRAIPHNWFRVVFAQDLMHPPEVIPGVEAAFLHEPGVGRFRFSTFLADLRSERHFAGRLLYLVVFVPAFIYRFSVKSTALIYLPLLWVIRSSTRPNGDFRQWFELQRRDVLEAWRRWYSIGSTFVLFAVPLWLFLFVNDMWTSLLQTVTKNQDPTVRAATALFVFLTPDTITFRSWHLARLANLFLTLWLWVYIERTAVRMAFQPTNERRIEHIISGALLLRGLLGLFVIACNLLILGRAVRWEDLPVVRFIWLP